jgi:hypothetical protein
MSDILMPVYTSSAKAITNFKDVSKKEDFNYETHPCGKGKCYMFEIHIDRRILCSLGASPTGEYCAGVHGGIIVPKGYASIYKIGLKTPVSERRCMRAYASKNPEYEARVLLGMDWLQEANPTIDWRKRLLTTEPSEREETITETAQDRFGFDSWVPEEFRRADEMHMRFKRNLLHKRRDKQYHS